MNIAIINDTFDDFGGAERVTLTMLEMFPKAVCITSFAEKWVVQNFLARQTFVLQTRWQILSLISTHRSLMQVMAPYLWGKIDLSRYDLVLSSACTLMCNMINAPHSVHIQYIHTIPKSLFGLLPKTPLMRLTHYDQYIAPKYRQAITNTPFILTSSRHMQQTIRRLFGIHAHILPPPVQIPTVLPKRSKPEFFLCVSRLDRDKHLELAVKACTKLGVPLRIVGVTNEPRYEQFLREIAGPTVQFLGFKSDKEIRTLYQSTIAFLFPSKKEDFGIAPLEALAHGVPVIAYYGGGPKETLKDGVTGVFFRKHTVKSLMTAIQRISHMQFSSTRLYRHAKQYSKQVFRKRLATYIQAAIKNQRAKHSPNTPHT
jgi:glycosyltransferase involved in cell wall biosynthesis